jgi:hypothetical protein
MFSLLVISVLVVACFVNSLILDHVLRQLKRKNARLYEEVLAGAEKSWVDKEPSLFMYADLNLVARLYWFILRRRDARIVTPIVWLTFTVCTVGILFGFVKYIFGIIGHFG